VTVAAVVAGSPAARAGIQAGDVITAIGGKATPTWATLRAAIAAKRPGAEVAVTYAGPGGGSRTVQVVLATFPPR
jgi:putative serine protease PepD